MLRTPALIAAFLLALTACTPIGQIPDSDYAWEERTLDVTYQQAYRNLREGFRLCPGTSIDGNLYDDTRKAEIDVYFATLLGGRAPGVLGLIKIDSDGSSRSKVRVGVQNSYDGPGLLGIGETGATRKRWLSWAAGDAKCA